MRTYVCDWCSRAKDSGARWILGYAAERVTSSGVQREISVEPAWSEKRADHPLAVHFCSEEHKEYYVAALFRVRKRTPVTRGSVSSSRRRVKRMETSRALGAVSVETEYQTEQLPPVDAITRKKRNKNPQWRTLAFDTADAIRSHGMSVRIEDRGRVAGNTYGTDHWNGS